MSAQMLRTVASEELESGPREDLADDLERGVILLFPGGAIRLPAAEDRAFLCGRLGLLSGSDRVRYAPESDELSGGPGSPGTDRDEEPRERTRSLLYDYHLESRRFLSRILPAYAAEWSGGEVELALSDPPTGAPLGFDTPINKPSCGERTLRLFTNLDQETPAVWRSGGTFAQAFAALGADAGIHTLTARKLRRRFWDRVIGESSYDRALRLLDETLRRSTSFQEDERGGRIEFPPCSSWLALTDGISHAPVRERHVLAVTWAVPRARLRRPELSPFDVMAGT